MTFRRAVARSRRSGWFRWSRACRRRWRRRAPRSRKRPTCAFSRTSRTRSTSCSWSTTRARWIRCSWSCARASATFSRCSKISRRRARSPTCTSASSRRTTAPATRRAAAARVAAAGSAASCRRCRRRSDSPPPNCMAPVGCAVHRVRVRPSGGPATTNLPNGTRTARRTVHVHGVGRRQRLRLRAPARVGLRGAAQHHRRTPASCAPTRCYRGRVRHQRGRRLGAARARSSTSRPARIRTAAACTGSTRAIVRRASPSTAAARRFPYGMPTRARCMGCARRRTRWPPTSTAAYDISRYIDYFTKQAKLGGVKDDPDDVILVGIDGPETPFATVLVDPHEGQHAVLACPSPMLSTTLHRGAAALVRERRAARASSAIRRCA